MYYLNSEDSATVLAVHNGIDVTQAVCLILASPREDLSSGFAQTSLVSYELSLTRLVLKNTCSR